MANYWRGPRDELIRRLHAQGLSIRKIRHHPAVIAANLGAPPSIGAVHRAVHRGELDDDGLDEDDGQDEPPAPPEDDEDDLMNGLWNEDGSANILTLHRLRYGPPLSPEQDAEVARARQAWEASLSPEERERRRWRFAGPLMKHEQHGTFEPVQEDRPWHVNLGKWTWRWTAPDAEPFQTFARWDSPAEAMADTREWVRRRWHGDESA